MEEESFEDPEIAKYLNEHYVAVKVDREMRPDIDAIYMAAVQALTGRGGWPMTVWLTPGRKPFYGGTYFPPRDGGRGAQTGFLTLLKTLIDAYENQPENITKNADIFVAAIHQQLAPAAGDALPGAAVLHAAAAHFANTLIRSMEAQKERPSSRAASRPGSCFATTDAAAMRNTSPWPNGRSKRWRKAESTTMPAEASTAMRPTRVGWCRISKRCSMTTRC
jgi:hypothetical protein